MTTAESVRWATPSDGEQTAIYNAKGFMERKIWRRIRHH
jgi:hypothetical protein